MADVLRSVFMLWHVDGLDVAAIGARLGAVLAMAVLDAWSFQGGLPLSWVEQRATLGFS